MVEIEIEGADAMWRYMHVEPLIPWVNYSNGDKRLPWNSGLTYKRQEEERPILRRVYPEDRQLKLIQFAPGADWDAMVMDPKYADTLFLYQEALSMAMTSVRGIGSAALRVYNKYGEHVNRPRSFGIVTQILPGERMIDRDFWDNSQSTIAEIGEIVLMMKYRRIAIFSREPPETAVGDDYYNFRTLIGQLLEFGLA